MIFIKQCKFSIPIPKPLPLGEGLCMLGWLCVSAIVVVCCRCVLHRLCSTTCMRPCIEPLGIHARHPCRGYIAGATAPSPCWGLRPKARTLWLLAKSFARCKTNKASNARHPIFINDGDLSISYYFFLAFFFGTGVICSRISTAFAVSSLSSISSI